MNLRQYKKKAKMARDVLIRDHGFHPKDFWCSPKNMRGEHDITTGENVDGKDRFGSIPHRYGTPTYLPEHVDYWGEANEPICCIAMLTDVIYWSVCGGAYAKKQRSMENA